MIEKAMNNRRMTAAIVLIVILVAANVMFLKQWRSADSELADVETQLQVANVSLTNARVEYDLAELRRQEGVLSRSPEFPTALPVVGLTLFLAEGALLSQAHLEMVDPPAKVGSEKIGGRSYPAYATEVTASGTRAKLISFLKYIEGGAFTSIRVESLEVQGSKPASTAVFTVVVISQT